LAKLILTNWEDHRDFIRQAGLTFETLEIAAGIRKRSLSRLEAQAQEVVEQYASIAIEARETWRSIRKTHPGIRVKSHPDWPNFEALRDQRGELANQIMQNPALYRPLLRETALAWEGGTDKLGKNHFGYGIPIVKAQAEAHQSKLLQQEMLKTASSTDPILAERLQTLLDYVETRDLTTSLWKDLRPKLKAFEGTLLSQGFSQEIDAWKDLRMARDQQAAKIVDYWEDYSNLIEKIGMKLDFDKLFEQKEQAIRALLFKAYTALPEDTISSEMAKLKTACELKILMDEEALQGKKTTIAQVYQQGLNPKDITRDALHYEERQICQTDEDHYYFKVIYSYHQSVATANGLYRTCLREGEKLGVALPDTPHYPEYLAAVANRNETAMNLLARDDWQECWFRAYIWNLDLDEDTLMTQMHDGQRGKLLEQYTGTDSVLVKLLISREVKDMLAEDQKEQRKATLADLYGRKITPSTIQTEAKQFDRMVAYANLAIDAEKQIFSALERYDEKLAESKRHYAAACREAKEQGISKENTTAYAAFQSALNERQGMASLAANAGRPHVVEGIAEDMGIILNTLYKDARTHELGMSHLMKGQPEKNEQAVQIPEKPDVLDEANIQSNPPNFSQQKDEKQYTPQEAEALAYLREEVRPEKHSWLSQGYSQNLIKAAEDDPLKALARWQDVADDYSFKPKTHETQDSHQEIIDIKILTYLREEVRPEKHEWLDKDYARSFLIRAEKEPLKMLQNWQDTTNDYSFNPFEGQLSAEELNVQDYMKQKLLSEVNGLDRQKHKELMSTLLNNPLETYRKWHLHTGDQVFDPTTGTPKIDQEVIKEARLALSKVEPYVSPEIFEKWQGEIAVSPDTVIKNCHDFLKVHEQSTLKAQEQDAKVSHAAQEFISLSEKHAKYNLPWEEQEKIRTKMDNLAEKYLSEKAFSETIEKSGSKAAMDRLNLEVYTREIAKNKERGRGMDC